MTQHVCHNPFPVRLDSTSMIIEEICRCGAFRADHEDTLVYGKGKCVATGCREFTWTNHVVETGDIDDWEEVTEDDIEEER